MVVLGSAIVINWIYSVLTRIGRSMKKNAEIKHGKLAGRVFHIALAAGGLCTASATAHASEAAIAPPSVLDEAPASPPPPVPLAVFGDNMPDPGKATLSVIPRFINNSHTLIGTKGRLTAIYRLDYAVVLESIRIQCARRSDRSVYTKLRR